MNFNPGEMLAKLRGGADGGSFTLALYAGAVIAVLLAVFNFSYLAVQADVAKDNITYASELRVVSQQIAKNALEAAAGNAEAFGELDAAKATFQESWDQVSQADVSNPELLTRVDQLWSEVKDSVNVILSGEDTVLDLHEVAATLSQTVPMLQAEYEGVVSILIDGGAEADQVSIAARQSLLAERIVRAINRVLAGGDGAVQAADSRSEEHTSELQSRPHLVCRLLLEKKKNKNK